MSVTRRDFDSAAALLRSCVAIKRSAFTRQPSNDLILIGDEEREMLAHFLSNWFEAENANFDRALFLSECGVTAAACPGCGITPNKGVTPRCSNPLGCGRS